MSKWAWLVFVAACTGGGDVPGDAGLDADVDAAPDAGFPAVAISASPMALPADGASTATLALTGVAGQNVLLVASQGSVAPGIVTLDGSGAATATLTACSDRESGCITSLTVTAKTGSIEVGSVAIALTLPPIAATAMCDVPGSVAYVGGAMHGSVTITALPDSIEFAADGNTRGTFDLLELPAALAPGMYEQATRAPTLGHPGLDLVTSGVGCGSLSGRFEIARYQASELTGEVSDALIGYELMCDGDPRTGCFHYAGTIAPPPPAPPTPDPAKVAVFAKLGATAIFRDPAGNTIADVAVDGFGFAEATVASGGEVSVIETDTNGTTISTYRAVKPGDAITLHPPQPNSGASDQMIASFTPPAGASSIAVMTGCGGGNWSHGPGPTDAYLTFWDGCRTDDFGMLTVAPTAPPQFIWQPSVHHAANGNAVVTGAWQPMINAVVTLQHIPSGTPKLAVDWAVQIGRTAHSFTSTSFAQPGSAEMVAAQVPTGVGDGSVVTVQNVSLLTGDIRTLATSQTPTTLSIDFAQLPVPVVSNLAQDAAGASWTATAGGADQRTVIWRAILSNGARVTELIYEPATGTSSSLPLLPAAHAAIDPAQDASAMLTGTAVNLIDYDVLPGYSTSLPTHDFVSHLTSTSTIQLTFPQ